MEVTQFNPDTGLLEVILVHEDPSGKSSLIVLQNFTQVPSTFFSPHVEISQKFLTVSQNDIDEYYARLTGQERLNLWGSNKNSRA